MEQPAFYFDLASPEAYLAAERVNSALGAVPAWIPVRHTELPEPVRPPGPAERTRLEARARALGLQALRWPPQVPADTAWAMLAATWCRHLGRGVAFALAASRQAYAGGRDLGERDSVLIAAAACELHPAALLKGAGAASNAARLQTATTEAAAAGVRRVPAVRVGRDVYHGEDGIDAAASALAREAVA